MKRTIAKVLQNLGIALLVFIIIICIPFALPRLMGYEIYEIYTESMEPDYPVGSVIYVKEIEATNVKVGDVITFSLGSATEDVLTHRVVEVDAEKGQFVTKGDANQSVDVEPVAFSSVIGTPKFCLKNMGVLAQLFRSGSAIWILGCGILVVFLLWMISDSLKKKANEMNRGE